MNTIYESITDAFDFATVNRKGEIGCYEETIGFVGMFNCFILMGL
jgi:hypothetical protein